MSVENVWFKSSNLWPRTLDHRLRHNEAVNAEGRRTILSSPSEERRVAWLRKPYSFLPQEGCLTSRNIFSVPQHFTLGFKRGVWHHHLKHLVSVTRQTCKLTTRHNFPLILRAHQQAYFPRGWWNLLPLNMDIHGSVRQKAKAWWMRRNPWLIAARTFYWIF